jgi:hypothetical protein
MHDLAIEIPANGTGVAGFAVIACGPAPYGTKMGPQLPTDQRTIQPGSARAKTPSPRFVAACHGENRRFSPSLRANTRHVQMRDLLNEGEMMAVAQGSIR